MFALSSMPDEKLALPAYTRVRRSSDKCRHSYFGRAPTVTMQQAFCHGTRSVRCSALKDNVAQLPSISGIASIKIPALDKTIPAVQGKMASVSIYNHLQQKYGKLNKQAALEGLSLYDEVVEDAIQRPGAHPNIDLLFEVRDKELELEMIVEKQ